LTFSFEPPDWNPTTYEEATKPEVPPAFVYAASKKLSEEAAWKYAKENQLSIVSRESSGSHTESLILILFFVLTVNPPMIYGPALQESAASPETLNTSSAAIYQLFSGKLQAIPDDRLPLFCDVRGTLLHLNLKIFIITHIVPDRCRQGVCLGLADGWCR